MSDEAAPVEVKSITFNIKSSSDQKHAVTVSDTMTVLDLKHKLSTSEYADVPAERQRLIYSGRVLKDPDTLASYKIKDGNTVHMVKGAASNQQRQPSSSASSASVPPGAGSAAGVPQNLASGTGNDPLAGLTGARYAGFAQMPGADTFGPDGGMGPPPNPDQMLDMLDNPMFQSQMNEAMNNPAVIQMMQNSPLMRNQPYLREMLNNPDMRRMMMDPTVIRQSMQMQRMMGGGAAPGSESMPAPGITDTTPQAQREAGPPSNSASPPNAPSALNPFTAMGGQQTADNPFASLFGGANPLSAIPSATGSNTTSNPATAPRSASNFSNSNNTQTPSQQEQQPPNPFAAFGNPSSATSSEQQNPMLSMMQNPELMRMAMQNLGLGGDAGAANPLAAAAGADPNHGGGFAQMMQQMMQGGAGGAMGGMGAPPAQPTDSRPPEEQYADQLRQLNDMGFFDFNQNVRALRMSGGRVEGAVEFLLS